MTIDDGADVPLGGLHPDRKIGDGGQGEVHTLTGLPGVLYKSYREPRQVVGGALTDLVAVRQALAAPDRAVLDTATAWPLCRVTDRGQVTGFLMYEAPASMTWTAGDGSTRLTELQYLLRPAKAAWKAVEQPAPTQRYVLAVALVELLDRLHAMGLILGDLSQANVLWTLRPAPAVFLLDCDGLRLAGRPPVLAQADTPDWQDPKAPPGQASVDGDRYKAALAVGRILCQDAYVRPGSHLDLVPGVLDDRREHAVRRLHEEADGAHGTRPHLGQWRIALAGRETIRLAAAEPAPRPQIDPAKFDGVRRRGNISLRD
ncbi:hypothetical protein LG634_15915 [Streptomyces bambusae]|uniref:hypothetical protein n=1 Tax=Streptomyces bambusae TaxID=1550616 RepID=UPI001CFC68A5|nr:hypothetical protein [Streptomyces bambusae]MCB5166316.1 hypothetical protein [Streptomyces bambusae]